MEETLWLMKQHSRQLQDYRKDIRGTWDDEAAKELNSHYLNPHEEDNQDMLKSLQQQQQKLEKAATELIKANEQALEADRRSRQVQHFLELTRQDVNLAYQYYERSREYHAATQAEFPIIERLIKQANLAC